MPPGSHLLGLTHRGEALAHDAAPARLQAKAGLKDARDVIEHRRRGRRKVTCSIGDAAAAAAAGGRLSVRTSGAGRQQHAIRGLQSIDPFKIHQSISGERMHLYDWRAQSGDRRADSACMGSARTCWPGGTHAARVSPWDARWAGWRDSRLYNGRSWRVLDAMCNSPEWPGSWASFLPCHGSHLPMRMLPSHASRWQGFSKWWAAGMRAS